MQLLMVLSMSDLIGALQAYATTQGHQMNATVNPVIDTSNQTVTIQLNN
jgi:hypothetical protein